MRFMNFASGIIRAIIQRAFAQKDVIMMTQKLECELFPNNSYLVIYLHIFSDILLKGLGI